MDLLFLVGNLLSLALLWLIVVLAYRTLWKALVVVTPAGDQTVDLFADEDPAEEFWLVPVGESVGLSPAQGSRVGRGLVVGRSSECQLRFEDPFVSEHHLKVIPHRDWCSVEDLGSANGYLLDGKPMQGHSLLKEGQCLSLGDLSVRLVRRHI